ncbi:alpha-2,8-sialyltransferase 8E-like [Branchiostoma floridae]|uniref:Alpha-2,8-sialyltransferase 8E-like n=1 Tax=Branchiostoma floridae TaxID=7739 RepID=A0A9J7LXI7_BRAFL|nr:alpha-2,8-sialyltransferase 8E-like [Branchiostoma floridae]
MRIWSYLLQFEIVVFVLALGHFGLLMLYEPPASTPRADCCCEERVQRQDTDGEWRLIKLSPVVDETREKLLVNKSLQTLAATEHAPTTVVKPVKKEPGSERWKVSLWGGFDFTTIRSIRGSVLKDTKVATHWYCSRTNMPLHSTFKFYDGKQQHRVMRGTYQYLPPETQFPEKLYRTCSVVGNGGILSGTGCGSQIDSADYVFRINLPPVSGDVGRKASFVTINPSLLTEHYGSLKSDDGRQNFTAMLDSYLGTTTFYTHPFSNINSLLVVTIAIAMCEETHVYGFWPFSTDLDGKPLNYHYYDRAVTLGRRVVSRKNQWTVVEMNKYHKMKTEHDRLSRLHEMGVVRMHVGTCDVTDSTEDKRNIQHDIETQTERKLQSQKVVNQSSFREDNST